MIFASGIYNIFMQTAKHLFVACDVSDRNRFPRFDICHNGYLVQTMGRIGHRRFLKGMLCPPADSEILCLQIRHLCHMPLSRH